MVRAVFIAFSRISNVLSIAVVVGDSEHGSSRSTVFSCSMPVVGAALVITDHVLRGGSDVHRTCMMHPDPRVVDVVLCPNIAQGRHSVQLSGFRV
jgi:hypothetical protein